MNFSTINKAHNKFQARFVVSIIVFLISLFATIQISFASEQLVRKYQELADKAGFSFTYGNLETHSGDAFTVHDITLIRYGVEDPIKIKSIKIEGARELSGNGLAADSFVLTGLSWDGSNQQGEEVIVTLRDGRIDGFYMPDPADIDAPLFIFEQYSVAFNDLFVLIDGNRVVEIPAITSVFNGSENTKQFSGFMKFSEINIFPENFKDGGKMKQQLASLGYDSLKLDISLEADWNLATGRLALSKYEFEFADIGAFNIEMAIGGYTEEFAKKLRIINAEIQTLPATERATASLKVMEEIASLTMGSIKLSFRDNSIAEKVIALQAEAAGQSPENMKAMLAITLSGALAWLQQPELAAKLVGAVEAFLAQPGMVFVAATPQSPLSFAEIIGLGAFLPGILIEKLNITAQAQ